MKNTLENFSLYLWNNPEGLHVTLTTNYNTAREKRSFFSFGNQTYKSWRAYNLYQPTPLQPFFAEFKNEWQSNLKQAEKSYWISKLGENTGNSGRRTLAGAMILFKQSGTFCFVMQLRDQYFEGEFDDSMLSERQRRGAKGQCVGAHIWKDQNQDQLDYGEPF